MKAGGLGFRVADELDVGAIRSQVCLESLSKKFEKDISVTMASPGETEAALQGCNHAEAVTCQATETIV